MSGRTFTEVQLEALESEFNKSNYHDVFSRDEMQNRMELPEQRSQVYTVFNYIYTVLKLLVQISLISQDEVS